MDRNKPCNCGSGNKYKKCCGSKNSPQKARNKIVLLLSFLLIIGAGYGFKKIMDQNRMGANPNAIFCQDCGRYH
tara:strand:+ start:261 stop:482 length:222 start_codon:yes stop_codon:yes gene_type:complete